MYNQAQMQQMQQYQQQMAQYQQQMQQRAGAAAGAPVAALGGEVGSARALRISGIKHEVVGPIIRGDYQLAQMNHGKPAYKKQAAGQGLEVMIYFWDERDGVASSGWWIGPQIGGNMVWGHHPSRTSATPPTSGWQAPHSAPADPMMIVQPMPAGVPGAPPAAAAATPSPIQMQQAAQQAAQQAVQAQAAQQAQLQGQLQQQQAMLQARQQQMALAQQQAQVLAQQQQMQRYTQQSQQQQQQQRQQQAVALKKQDAGRKQEEHMKRQTEAKAASAIRKGLNKYKAVVPETFEAMKTELVTTLTTAMPTLGSQAAVVQAEFEKVLTAMTAKCEQMNELRKKNEDRLKEMERKRDEAKATSKKLTEELAKLVEAGEQVSKKFAEQVKVLSEKTDLTSESSVNRACGKVEAEGERANEKVMAMVEFVKTHTNAIKSVPGNHNKDKEEDGTPSFNALQKAAYAIKASVDKDIRALKAAQVKFLAKASAGDVVKKQKVIFSKYDKNRDAMLDKKEILAFGKGEYNNFTVPEATLDMIFTVIVEPKAKGVKFDDFTRLVAAIGVARERAQDLERRAVREEREQELAVDKAKIQVVIDEILAVIKEASTAVTELGVQVRNLPKDAKEMKAVAMVAKAGELEESVKEVEAKLKAAQEHVDKFGETDIKDLAMWAKSEKNRLHLSTKNLESSITRAKATITNFASGATKKDEAEVKTFGATAMARLRAFLAAEQATPAELFKKVAGYKSTFDKDMFAAFMVTTPKAEGEKEGEDIAEEDFARAFAILDEEKSGAVSEETLVAMFRKVMKVVKDVAMTGSLSIKDTKSVRRLEVGEAVEVLEGPVEEGDLKRIRAKALLDGQEGWLSVSGSAGTKFLEDGGSTFKVVKDTILTECFDLDAGTNKAATRKLKAGELLEVRTWGKKQDGSGLTRMRCKAKSDGMIGFVTTIGNTGIKFVELV